MRFTDENGFTLVDHDFASGRSTWRANVDGKTVYRVDMPVDNIVKVNAEHKSIAQNNWKGDYHMIASVPTNVAWDTGIVDAVTNKDDKFLSKWLNDSDNRLWRTKDGRI